MRLNLIGCAPDDVDTAAISFPSRKAGAEMLVGVGDAAIMLFLVFVLGSVGRWVAAQPEVFDELITLFVVGERFECGDLFGRDDVDHVLFQPLLVGAAQLLFQSFGVLFLLLLGQRTLQGIGLITSLRRGCACRIRASAGGRGSCRCRGSRAGRGRTGSGLTGRLAGALIGSRRVLRCR